MAAVASDGVSAPLPGRCGFYVAKKKRYCKMVAGNGRKFCGEHGNADPHCERKRIPCPLDPKHTVFEDSLVKHLKKCNSKEKPKPVYYVKDINAGSVTEEENATDEVSIAERSKEELDGLIQKLKTAVKGLNTEPDTSLLSHPALNEALNDPKNGNFAFKHLKQQASILGNMEALDLLGSKRCYVEFGAGKDGKHKNTDSTFDRLQVDIQHLDLSRVPFLQEKRLPVIAVGKHLCGAATDLALRCLFERSAKDHEPPTKRLKLQEGSEEVMHGSESSKEVVVSGLAVALCCHHRCDWRHYVGKDFFRERGLGATEFSAFQRMSSWATCGMSKVKSSLNPENSSQENVKDEEGEEGEHEGSSEDVPDHLNNAVSAEEREYVGRLCKMLINHGRLHYLQQKGFTSSLRYYTSRDVSLENVLLTALPS
ncbi:tRNA:m(4)X modification enzyme TRM13 homolog isoform X2 [Neoarius graeffei]|uniref:tRNA:m(4)X modification enzyme TRM13 homolog isoform X2 n=1 Tax=Neoarius graeffei TaxID=443677 RepID=UPI00298BEACC|nr:tRNA:m(4)X modification enzyme TRM13 homolog isoform X2 [Neoarius graeffei]